MPRMLVSQHAAERLVERVKPEWTVDQAYAHLVSKAQFATRLNHKTLLGQPQFEMLDPPCVLVAKRTGGDDSLTVVTVLPPRTKSGEGELSAFEEDLIEELQTQPRPTQERTLSGATSEQLTRMLALQRKRIDWEIEAAKDEQRTERVRLTTGKGLARTTTSKTVSDLQDKIAHLWALTDDLIYAVRNCERDVAQAIAAIEEVREGRTPPCKAAWMSSGVSSRMYECKLLDGHVGAHQDSGASWTNAMCVQNMAKVGE